MQGILLLCSAWAQDEEGEEGSAEPEAEPEAESEGEAEGDAEEAPGDGEAAEEDGEGADEDGEDEEAAEEDEEGADEDGEEEEECEEVELGDGGDDIESILDPSEKKCKPKAEGGESSEDEPTGSEALAAEVDFPFLLTYYNQTSRWEWKPATKRAWTPKWQTA